MKAVRVNQWGGPVALEEIAQPQPASDEVLVRVHAASINPLDAFVLAGYMQGYVSLPLTLGTDFAGEVVETGSEISHVQPGDAVYGLTVMHGGTFAEYTVAKANEVTHKPKTMSFIEAAGVPLATLAAYQSLLDLGQAKAGERVLIIGAGGAVGSCAVQLAKALGARVLTVDITNKTGVVRALEPDAFIDCSLERYETMLDPVDLVLDYVGGEHLQRSLSLLPTGGRYITSMMLPAPPEEAEQRGIKTAGLATEARVDQLEKIAGWIDAGQLKTTTNCTFPLEEAQAALEYRMTTPDPGKVVLIVR